MTEPEVRKPVALRTLHGIELAAVGTWKASTGETTFTQEDFVDAVAALQCPGVRNPVIKLGHAEPDSDSGVRWDGEPAVGWVANMRFDGAKMLGDFTGVPAWLADADENGLSVMAAAYPDRSIEIYRPFQCQIGHLHPSVITAVSLLGVGAPGVGVLKSMQDVYAAFTQSSSQTLEKLGAGLQVRTLVKLAAAEPRQPTEIEKRSGVDFEQVRASRDEALAELLEQWPEVAEAQQQELSAQIETAVDLAPDDLGSLTLDTAAALHLLQSSMTVVAAEAARQQVAEALSQGVKLPDPDITEDTVRDVAEAVTAAMAASTASTAGRTAAQALGTGDGKQVAAATVEHLQGLGDRFLRDELGGALSAAQARGRFAVLEAYDGPADYYGSEINDTEACEPCREVDGRKFDTLAEALQSYGAGKYVGCSGGPRCRGQLITIFDSGKVPAQAAAISTTIRMTLEADMPTATGGLVKASVSVEDISRKYYEAAGYSMWITELQVDPLQLIAADDATGKHYRIPVELSGDDFAFGDPQEVAVSYVDVKAAASAPVKFGTRKAALTAAGKNEDGTDRISPDVSPAGAAIRKAQEKADANAPAVIETEIPETPAPDADPAAGPITTPKEASVDAAKMREALGLAADATDEEVRQAALAAVTPAEPVTQADPAATLSAIPPSAGGAMLIDPENYKTLVAMAAKGEAAFAEVQKNRRDQVLGQAMKDGRFPVARLAAYQQMWDQNPEATDAYINLMPKQSVPTMAAGFLGKEINQNEADMVYDAMYPGKAA